MRLAVDLNMMFPEATEQSFREAVRAEIRSLLPSAMAQRNAYAVHPTREDMLEWTSRLATRGWSVPGWPTSHGGTGWSRSERLIFEEEGLRAGAPPLHPQSIWLIGPLICRYGTPEQQRRWLPDIREGRLLWAQGFSEPGAGSDLGAVRTKAVRDGEDFVVNGQKIWISHADMCDNIFCLVRTSHAERRQHGLSILCFPLNAPGVAVRPISLIDGSQALCEVFLDDVRVPASSLLGAEGEGWALAKWLLDNERIGTAELPRNRVYIQRLLEQARATSAGVGAPARRPDFNARLAEAQVDLEVLEAAALSVDQGADPRPLASVLKLAGTALMQRTLDMQVELLDAGLAMQLAESEARPLSPIVQEALFRRAATIYGGTSEVQRTIIARAILTGDRLKAPEPEEAGIVRQAVAQLIQHAPKEGGARAAISHFAAGGWTEVLTKGSDGDAGDLIVPLFEEMGRTKPAGPLLGVVAPLKILDRAGPEWRSLFGAARAGAEIVALAHQGVGVEARAEPIEGGWLLSGTKTAVLNGGIADRFLIPAREPAGEMLLFVVAADRAGLTVRPHRLIDGRDSADVLLDGVSVEKDDLVAGAGGEILPVALSRAMMLACVEAVGTMDEGLWLTRDYLRTRFQFGRSLAEFQALQHRLADMYAKVVLCRALVVQAVRKRESLQLAYMCRQAVGAAAEQVGREIIQLHGAIGMTSEYAAGALYCRLEVFGHMFGGWRTQRDWLISQKQAEVEGELARSKVGSPTGVEY